MSQIIIDDALFPIIVQRLRGVIADADIEAMIAWYDRLFAQARGRHAVIVHAEIGHRPLSAPQRRRIADWQNRNIDRRRALAVGTAIILESSVQRGALTALNWLAAPPAPQKAVGTMREALDWCIEKLAAAEVPIPPAVHDYRAELVSGAKRA